MIIGKKRCHPMLNSSINCVQRIKDYLESSVKHVAASKMRIENPQSWRNWSAMVTEQCIGQLRHANEFEQNDLLWIFSAFSLEFRTD